MDLPGGYDVAVILHNNKAIWTASVLKDQLTGAFLSGVVFALEALQLEDYMLLNDIGNVYSTTTLFNLVTEDGALLVEFDERDIGESELRLYQGLPMCKGGELLCMGDLCVMFHGKLFVEGAQFMCKLSGRDHCEVQVK